MAPKTEQELIELVRTKARAYLKLPNVTSVGVGKRIVAGETKDELAIQFTVGKKLVPELVVAEGLTLLPETIVADDGTEVPVDIVERSYTPSFQIVEPPSLASLAPEALTPAQIRRRRQDPIRPGLSIAHTAVTAGTIGGIVFDAANGTPLILSNWHVLHGPDGTVGDLVVQPGPLDDANIHANGVGRLVRSHLGLSGDCAVASIVGRRVDERVFELDVVPRRIAEPNIDDLVVKSGRTTGVTFGIVRRTGVSAKIDYGGSVGEREVGGFEIGPNPSKPPSGGEISSGGDSGSFWLVDEDGARDVVVGLHFAGETDPNPSAEHALACNIRTVFEKLQVSFVRPESEAETPRKRRSGSSRKKSATRAAS
jgi:endonuclease G